MTRHIIAGVLALAVVSGAVVAAQSSAVNTTARGAGAYNPPRTSWGDPDLQGIWPGTEMVGVPLQRPAQFGTRNVLTDEEFRQRVAQASAALKRHRSNRPAGRCRKRGGVGVS